MVRLRRELEGIHLDRSVPPPPWAERRLSDVISPSWLDAVRAIDGERVLFCGIVHVPLALSLARDGKWVTLSDLSPGDVRRISAALDPDVAGRVQLVAKPYGSATFSPSSFDTIILSDQLHAYDAPEWVLQKVKRELKVDGVLLARLHVAGPLPTLPDAPAPLGAASPSWAAANLSRTTPWLNRLVHSSGAPVWLSEAGLDAVQRRALWQADDDTPNHRDLGVQLDAITSRLHLEGVHIGSTLRAAALTWGAGAHAGPSALAVRIARGLPEFADQDDRARIGARAVWIQARRALMSGGKALTFG